MGDALYIPQTAGDIANVPGIIPSADVQAALNFLAGQITTSNNPYGFINASNYGVASSITTTTLSASLNSGSNLATVASTNTFAIGHGVAIAGAGANGGELITSIQAINGNVLTLATNAITTANAGHTVYHDDTAGLQAAINSNNPIIFVGPCNITSPLQNTASLVLKGVSMASSYIYTRRTNIDGLLIKANALLRDFSIYSDPLITTTAGAAIHAKNPSAPAINVDIENVSAYGYEGIYAEGATLGQIVRSWPMGVLNGLHINTPMPYGGWGLTSLQCYVSGAGGWSCFIDQIDTSRMTDVNITANNQGGGLKIGGASGYCNNLMVNIITIENCSGKNLSIGETGGTPRWCKLSNVEINIGTGAFFGSNALQCSLINSALLTGGVSVAGMKNKVSLVSVNSGTITIVSGASKCTVTENDTYSAVVDNGTGSIVANNVV